MATNFSPTSFAEGRFRRAYKGTFTEPPSKKGKQCVAKEKKASYTWAATDKSYMFTHSPLTIITAML